MRPGEIIYVGMSNDLPHLNGQSFELGPGDSYHDPSDMEHSAITPEPSVIVEAFSPPRDDDH